MSTAAAHPDSPLPSPEHLPDDPTVLKRLIVELLATMRDKDRELEGVRHRLELLLRRLYGSRNERFDPNQPLLFGDPPAAAEETPAAAAAETPAQRRARPHGRRRLPDNLPREPRHHELSEAERICADCGRLRIDIGVAPASSSNTGRRR